MFRRIALACAIAAGCGCATPMPTTPTPCSTAPRPSPSAGWSSSSSGPIRTAGSSSRSWQTPAPRTNGASRWALAVRTASGGLDHDHRQGRRQGVDPDSSGQRRHQGRRLRVRHGCGRSSAWGGQMIQTLLKRAALAARARRGVSSAPPPGQAGDGRCCRTERLLDRRSDPRDRRQPAGRAQGQSPSATSSTIRHGRRSTTSAGGELREKEVKQQVIDFPTTMGVAPALRADRRPPSRPSNMAGDGTYRHIYTDATRPHPPKDQLCPPITWPLHRPLGRPDPGRRHRRPHARTRCKFLGARVLSPRQCALPPSASA